MLDPQVVRQRRQEAKRKSQIQKRAKLMEESKKIFQWILKYDKIESLVFYSIYNLTHIRIIDKCITTIEEK